MCGVAPAARDGGRFGTLRQSTAYTISVPRNRNRVVSSLTLKI